MSILEFHVLQSFPVSCLNRDDVGSPKSALVGGVLRARVSSQCWKRAVRLELHKLGIHLGMRTKKLNEILLAHLNENGLDEAKAQACADVLSKALADDTLLFFTDNEIEKLVEIAKKADFEAEKISEKEIQKLNKKFNKEPLEGLDIALFGRMVAKATSMNVEAASCFSHAISTHAMTPELEFFTAMDDCQTDPGSSHMGTLEFNSATYYRYISLNVDQLKETLGIESQDDLKIAVSAFIKALYLAVPNARQTTMSASNFWDFARIYVRDGQRLQCGFDKPVKKTRDGGYLEPSIEQLKAELDRKEKQAGSLFGKRAVFEFGESDTSIDDIINDVVKALEE